MDNNSKSRLPLLGLLHQETSKAALLEEKLQALSHKIHQLQSKDMLQKKVAALSYRNMSI